MEVDELNMPRHRANEPPAFKGPPLPKESIGAVICKRVRFEDQAPQGFGKVPKITHSAKKAAPALPQIEYNIDLENENEMLDDNGHVVHPAHPGKPQMEPQMELPGGGGCTKGKRKCDEEEEQPQEGGRPQMDLPEKEDLPGSQPTFTAQGSLVKKLTVEQGEQVTECIRRCEDRQAGALYRGLTPCQWELFQKILKEEKAYYQKVHDLDVELATSSEMQEQKTRIQRNHPDLLSDKVGFDSERQDARRNVRQSIVELPLFSRMHARKEQLLVNLGHALLALKDSGVQCDWKAFPLGVQCGRAIEKGDEREERFKSCVVECRGVGSSSPEDEPGEWVAAAQFKEVNLLCIYLV